MKRVVLLVLFALMAAVATRWQGARGTQAARADEPACTCALERERNGWCQVCRIGYAAGLQTRSYSLYEALDLHGHDVDVGSLDCGGCRVAAGSDGFCAACNRGFLGGRAYLSPLAYHLARGESRSAAQELALLERAIAAAERCELCAAAMVVDGTCPVCRISYRDGREQALPAVAR